MVNNSSYPASITKIEHVPIGELKPATYNPRKWDKSAIQQLTESITRFGLVDPILVNGAKERKNIVIGGHFRLKIAKDLGYKKVPVVFLNIPDEEKEKELNLRLNRNTGEFDLEKLKDFNIDMLLDIGFDDSDLSSIWDDALNIEDDNFDTQKELEKAQESPQTKVGDIYQLGKHKLVCGDSTDPSVIQSLLEKEKIDMVYSDPPYNINLDYEKGISGKQQYASEKVNDNKSDEEYGSFLDTTIKNALQFCKSDSHIFFYCDQNYIGLIQELYKKNKIKNQRVCLWVKNNHNMTPQIAFNKCYEPCIYGTIGKPFLSDKLTSFNEVLNPEVGVGNRTIDDIEDLLDIWLVKRLPSSEYAHPTQKPVNLHERPLKRCTKVGDNVLDLFGGSGSTLVSCEQLGRRAFLIEKDPAFCDVIIARYLALNPSNNVKKIN